MGAWGEGPFDNDAAGDWAYDFEGLDAREGLGLLQATLSRAAPARRGRLWKRGGAGEEHLDADDGSVAVAAAEIVAHLVDGSPPPDAYGGEVYAWAARTSATADRPLVDLALVALGRVTGERSELADLWDESDGGAWRSSIRQIEQRLQAAEL
jgi:hypothetical protein